MAGNFPYVIGLAVVVEIDGMRQKSLSFVVGSPKVPSVPCVVEEAFAVVLDVDRKRRRKMASHRIVGVVDAVGIEVKVHTVARTVVLRAIHWNMNMTQPVVAAVAVAVAVVVAAVVVADTRTDSLAESHNTANDPALPDLTDSGSNAIGSPDVLDSSDYTTVFRQPRHF